MAEENTYGAESIQVLEGLEASVFNPISILPFKDLINAFKFEFSFFCRKNMVEQVTRTRPAVQKEHLSRV